MKTNEIVTELSRYFDIRELVSRAVYEKYGNTAWRFFDVRLLETLLLLRRDILQVPLICNNWKNGGTLQQRGLRENTCEMVRQKTTAGTLYISAHTLGKGVDLSSSKMTADQMRERLLQCQDQLPYPVRIEAAQSAPTWLHIDVATSPDQKEKVFIFQ